MSTVLWVILGLTVWTVAPLPLALLVGRALRRAGNGSRPASRGTATHVLAA